MSTAPPSAAPQRLQRILVVDDNVDAADSLAMLLGVSGYEVRVAYDGRQALEVVAEFDPALVILDIRMPVMDGLTAARTLRLENSSQRLRLIALTGLTHPADRADAMESGFDMILPKPIEGSQMRQMVDSVLGGLT
jgi:two-component system, sensor histidine kinase